MSPGQKSPLRWVRPCMRVGSGTFLSAPQIPTRLRVRDGTVSLQIVETCNGRYFSRCAGCSADTRPSPNTVFSGYGMGGLGPLHALNQKARLSRACLTEAFAHLIRLRSRVLSCPVVSTSSWPARFRPPPRSANPTTAPAVAWRPPHPTSCGLRIVHGFWPATSTLTRPL